MTAFDLAKFYPSLVKGVKDLYSAWPKYCKMKCSLTAQQRRLYERILLIIEEQRDRQAMATWSGKYPTGIEVLEAFQEMTDKEFGQIYNAVLLQYLNHIEQHAVLEHLKAWRDKYNIPANDYMLHYWMVSPGWKIIRAFRV